MKIEIIERKNVVDEVYKQMKQFMMSGEWAPGHKTPSENELSKMFGVSRNTVRSAIQKFKAIGVLKTVQGQGTFVCESIGDELVDSLIPLIHLDRTQIFEILEFRKMIEIESVGLAASKADEEDITRIEQSLERMIQHQHDYKKFSIADYQFHLNIAKASKNSIFYRIMTRLEDLIYTHFEEMNKQLGGEMSVNNHAKIFRAIKDREPELARFLMRENIEQAMNHFKSILS